MAAHRYRRKLAVAGQALSTRSLQQWQTPTYVLDAARDCMGGIDLDPASCASANERVGAASYFDPDTDGLSAAWPQQRIEPACRLNPTRVMNHPVMLDSSRSCARALPATDGTRHGSGLTQRFLPAAFGILQEWAASYVCTLVWHKAGGRAALEPSDVQRVNLRFIARLGKPAPFARPAGVPDPLLGTDRLGDCASSQAAFYQMPSARVTVGRLRIDPFSRTIDTGLRGVGQ